VKTTIDRGDHLCVIVWLCSCSILIFSMILLGGGVRLTGSGLSMVDWKPLMGIVPPMSEVEWNLVFDQYKLFPEYKTVNHHMNLSEFKFIFLIEYAHRVLGRVIGLAFFLPFVFFLATKKLSAPLIPRLWVLLILGAIQGGVGWYMVKSGLVDDHHVSQYRLTMHFMLAVVIYLYILRLVVGLLYRSVFCVDRKLRNMRNIGITVLVLLLVMITTGCFVAGTQAGFIYNTYPKMGSALIPQQLWVISPIWINFFENPVTIQFIHRWLAIGIMLLVIYYAARIYCSRVFPFSFFISIVLCFAVIFQVLIGIFTLVYRVPITLGIAHQGGALVLLSIVIVSVMLMFPGFYFRD